MSVADLSILVHGGHSLFELQVCAAPLFVVLHQWQCPCRYSDKIGFRERSETAEIAIALSLQPWEAFQPDGVIMFSDILTPLPALGIEFDVLRGKGPFIEVPIRRWAT
jgi:Uroporphyrinogen decarboxylase (URO-D)